MTHPLILKSVEPFRRSRIVGYRCSLAQNEALEATSPRRHPTQDLILVRPVAGPEGGDGPALPDTARAMPLEALVVSVGDDKARSLDIRAGDRVLFLEVAGNEVQLDGVEHLLLRVKDVLAVVGR